MKTIFITLCSVLAFAACTEDTNPVSSNVENEGTAKSSSSSISDHPSSSSSSYSPSVTTGSQDPIPYEEPDVQYYYIAEIGFVCNGFNYSSALSEYASTDYLIMYDMCGNRATMSSGTTPRTVGVIVEWMYGDLNLSEWFVDLVVNDIQRYGQSFRFYEAVDGYIRYFYLELAYDGKGLMKQNSE